MADSADLENGAVAPILEKSAEATVVENMDEAPIEVSAKDTHVVAADVPAKDAAPAKKPGVCMIKAEFINHNHVRELVTDYLPAKAKEAIKEDAAEASTSTETGEPPAKKAKIKGRNKDRPREKRQAMSERFCPAILRGRECAFGDRCKFCHDVTKYMETKPDDLGDSCHLYRTYGRCNYGVSCRFAKDHMDENFKSLEKEELVAEYADRLTVSNLIDKDVQRKLWKKKYNFKKAERSFQAAKAATAQNHENKQTKDAKSDNGVTPAQSSLEDSASKTVIEESSEANTSSEAKVDNLMIAKTPLLEKVIKKWGPLTESVIRIRPEERKTINFSDKLYLAPLTTVGNLPFRRVCKAFGADITCGEMALATNLLQGQQSEWALLKRHETEDIFGAQICGSYPDTMSRCAQVLCENTDIDFIDINCGCPIDLIFKRGEGSALMGRHNKLQQVVKSMIPVMDVPLTLKCRTGIFGDKNIAHTLIPKLRDWGISLCTLHGRSREQRYTKLANWNYIEECAAAAKPMPFFGNGDILSYEDAVAQRQRSGISGLMIARGALIKPWIFTEIKEERHWDISSSERLDMLRRYTNAGLEHWGSDQQGISTTRRFLLEWLSFLYRYIPVGVLERVPQHINEKPPYYFGRDDLETLMASSSCTDWIKITELLLGPVPDDFTFLPKHRANSYS